tara:strand:+ start:862 stop:1467 length:606 start_codon:yes stop_codon:yes gene_type:complete
MVTYDKRYEYLKESVKYFNNQTYPNKELIIVIDNNEEYYQKIYEEYSSENVFVYNGTQKGIPNLRNITLEKSNGEYVIIWDDDDESRPKRLEIQMWPIIYFGYDASILNGFQIKRNNEILFVSWKSAASGTLLFKKTNDIIYKNMTDDEIGDTSDAYVLNSIAKTQKIFYIKNNHELFVYNLHEENTSGINKQDLFTYKYR